MTARRGRGLARAAQPWMREAACAGHCDPDLWFAEREDGKRQRQALRICAACPVRSPCLAYALSLPPQPGIWGGTTEDQRNRIVRLEAGRAGRRGDRQAGRARPPGTRQRHPDRDRGGQDEAAGEAGQ